MKISKQIIFKQNIKINLFSTNKNSLKILLITDSGKFLKKVIINSNLSPFKNSIAFFGNLGYNKYFSILDCIKNMSNVCFYGKLTSFGKIYMIGLGFKNFVLGNSLYILVGDCNYIVFEIPISLKVFCKKNQIYLLSNNEVELFNFMSNIKNVKKSNFYKGKGVLQFKNFKFTKLKVGKKQRFM